MKDIVLIACMSAPSIILAVFSGIMAYHDKGGWGWFLFVAMVCAGWPYKSKETERGNDD